jgi:hypothetical protein
LHACAAVAHVPEMHAEARYDRPLHVAHEQQTSAHGVPELHDAPAAAPCPNVPHPHESSVYSYVPPGPVPPPAFELPAHDDPQDASAPLDEEQPRTNARRVEQRKHAARIARLSHVQDVGNIPRPVDEVTQLEASR